MSVPHHERSEVALLEGIERDAWLDLYAAAPPGFAAAVGLSATRIGSTGLFAIRAVPLVQFNHAHAFFIDGALQTTALAAAKTAMEERASPVWAIQIPDLPEFAFAGSWLKERGFLSRGGWVKFSRPAVPADQLSIPLRVDQVSGAQAADFGSVVQEGFGAPPPFASWAGGLVGRPGWRTYVGYDGDTPVAAGALFMAGGLGWLGLGATIPSHRGRGAQKALLTRRINDAIRAGAGMLVTETGRPGPGEEAKHPSYRNILRAGFREVYLRANYAPPAVDKTPA